MLYDRSSEGVHFPCPKSGKMWNYCAGQVFVKMPQRLLELVALIPNSPPLRRLSLSLQVTPTPHTDPTLSSLSLHVWACNRIPITYFLGVCVKEIIKIHIELWKILYLYTFCSITCYFLSHSYTIRLIG